MTDTSKLQLVATVASDKRDAEAQVEAQTQRLASVMADAYQEGAQMKDLVTSSGYSAGRIRQLLMAAGLKGEKGKRMS